VSTLSRSAVRSRSSSSWGFLRSACVRMLTHAYPTCSYQDIVLLYILGLLVLAVKEKMNGESPWTRKTHELQGERW
jgi:hypothetical protein